MSLGSMLRSRLARTLMGIVLGLELVACVMLKLHVDQQVRYALQLWQLRNPIDDLSHPFAESADSRIRRALAGGPLVIPFRYGESGEILIPVEVNGKKLEFVFDTGASHLVMFKTFASRFEPLAIADRPRGPGRATLVGVFTASRLGLAQARLENVRFGILDYGALGTYQAGAAGLFGGGLLEHFCVTIDYHAKKIILSSPNAVSSIDVADSIVVPLEQRNNLSHTAVRVNGRSINACLDTGAIFNTIYDSDLDELTKPIHFDNSPVWCGPGFGMQRLLATQLDSLQVGSYTEKQATFELLSGRKMIQGCLIGNDFCSQFKQVTFDYLNKRIIFAHPNQVSAVHLVNEGSYWLQQGKADRALALFTQAEELEPQWSGHCDAARGYAQLSVGNYAQAIVLLNGAIAADPFKSSLYIARANAYEGLDEYAKAIDDLTAAINLQPEVAQSFVARARIAADVGHYRQAISDCDRAIELDANLSTAYGQRAWCYERLGDHDRAIELFTQYVQAHPKDSEGYENRAWCYMNIKRYDLAVKDSENALKLSPKLSAAKSIRERSQTQLTKLSLKSH